MFLASLGAIPFCRSLGSSLPVFSRCAHVLLSGWTVSPPSGRHCLTQSTWGAPPDSSLLPAYTFLDLKAQECSMCHKLQINPIVLQPGRDNNIFEWAACHWISKLDALAPWCCAARLPSSLPVGGCVTLTWKTTSASGGFSWLWRSLSKPVGSRDPVGNSDSQAARQQEEECWNLHWQK